jgi:hypothetical protein
MAKKKIDPLIEKVLEQNARLGQEIMKMQAAQSKASAKHLADLLRKNAAFMQKVLAKKLK